MGIAPLVAAVRRRPAHWMFGVPSISIPASLPDGGTGDVIGLKVEIYLGAPGWTDISSFVYYRDKIHITRGRSDETSQPQPQTCGLTLNNRGGIFTPRNAAGPYYGLIGRNTPIRVSRLNNGVRRYRYSGEVPTWPTTSDISGADVYIQVPASGMLRRLQQGTPPTQSAMYRAYTLTNAVQNVVAYWPCEDGTNATTIASGLSGGSPMAVTGTPTFASDSSFICSQPIPALNGSSWSASISAPTWTDNVLRFLMHIPATGEIDGAIVARFFTGGTVARVDLRYNTAFGGELTLLGYDGAGNTLFNTGSFIDDDGVGYSGGIYRVGMGLRTSGTGIEYSYQTYKVNDTKGGASVAGTLSSSSVGPLTGIVISPNQAMAGTSIGHVSVQNAWDSLFDIVGAINAYLGEGRLSRFARLANENNVNAITVFASQDSTSSLGYQLPDTFPNLLQQVPDTDMGALYETRDQLALAYRTRGSLYNQGTTYNNVGRVLTLDHSLHQLSGPLNPVDDDAFTRNDVTVTRIGGSSSRQVLASGAALSVQAPPAGVGPYPTAMNVSLNSDTATADQAGWRLHLGTVNEPRYPQISLNLRHPTFTSSVDMMNAALTLDIGDRIVIVNPPPELPPDPISLIVQGYTEVLGVYEHDMVLTCSPESPYEVGILDDPALGHLDTDGSTLALAYPLGTETTIQVATTNPASPSWTTSAGDFPFDIAVGGERITVTNIGAAPAPATGVDGTFETGITGWIVNNGTLVQTSAQAHSGTFSGLLTANSLLVPAMKTAPFPVVANASYLLNCWGRLAVGTPTSLLLVIQWSDGGGNFITQNVTPAIAPVAAWVQQPIAVTAPSNAATALIILDLHVSTTSDAAYIDDLSLTQTTGGTQPFTVTRSVNGVVKSQLAGTDVRLQQPMILSL
jgi:hypothetical protein